MNRAGLLWRVGVVCLAGAVARAARPTDTPGISSIMVDGLMVDEFKSPTEARFFDVGLRGERLAQPRQPFQFRFTYRPSARLETMPVEQEVHAQVAAAQMLMQQGNWPGALDALQKALVLDPENSLLIQQAASAAVAAKKLGVADGYYRRLVQANPAEPAHLVGWVAVLLRLRRMDDARIAIEKALAMNPRDLAGRFNLECVRLATAAGGEAASSWEPLLTIPEMLPVVYQLMSEREELTAILKPDGFRRLCGIVLGAGTEERLTDIASALEMAQMRMRAVQWSEAEAVIEGVWAMGVQREALQQELARIKHEKGEEDAALALLRRLIEARPTYAPLLFNYGYLLLRGGRYAEAVDVLERARTFAPDDPPTVFALACAYAGKADAEKSWPLLFGLASSHGPALKQWLAGDEPYVRAIRADERFEQLFALAGRAAAPEAASLSRAALQRLRAADLYLRESKGEQALAELQQALALEPDNRFLLERAALAASMAQEPGPAEAFFRKLIELDPQAVSYRVGLAGVFFRLGRQAEAEEAVRQALQISPRDLPGRYTRVCVLVAQGRGDEAGSSWEALLTAEELDPVVNSVIADRENLRQALGDGGVSAVCGILLGPGTDGRLPEIAGALKDVRAAMGERRWADAEQALAAAWNLGVDRTALKLDLVRCRYEAGDPDTARDLMKDLIEKYPRYATLRFNYGFLLLRSASYAEAATAFEEGLKDAPEDRQMAFALACSLAGQGMTDSAWPILTNLAQVAGSQLTRWLASDAPYVLAIREDERYDRLLAGVRRQPAPAPRPPSGDALRRMRAADRFIQEQNWEHALAELEEGLRLDPEHSSLLRKAAVVAAILRKDTVAEDHFRRFLDLDPDNVPHLSGWAAVLIRMGRLDDADAALRRALALAPRDLASRFLMTCADLARGRALTAGKEWLFVSTDEMESIAGWMLADEDDLRRTLGDGGFAKLCDLALGPGAAARLSDVAAVLRDIRQGMAAGDWEDVDTAIEGARAMGLHETAVQSALGRARFQAGDHEAALEILRDLAGKNPGVLSAQFNYGFVLVKTGDFEQAASVYERAHGMDPANTQVAFGLACAHAGRGDLDRAWPLLEELVRVGERNLMGWLEGDEPYLRAIRGDARYPALVAKLVASGESRR